MESSYVTIIRALNSPIRRLILKLCSENAFSINELVEKFTANNVDFKSRDSLYKQTELLVTAGLLDKFYDVDKKAISYKNPVIEVVIDIENSSVQQRKVEEKILNK